MKIKRHTLVLCQYLAITIALTSIAGCAASGTGELFTLEPTRDDVVTVYHYRKSRLKASAFTYHLLSNDKVITQIGNGGYFKELVQPGEIIYKTKIYQDKGPFNLDDLITNAYQDFELAYTLQAAKGKIFFLKWTPKVFGGPPKIELVSQEQAVSDLSGLRAFLPASEFKGSE